jgi:RNA polymerase sigma factor (sigma-70 family)
MRAKEQAFPSEQAFEQLYREHGGTVLAYCLRRADRQAAEDALAETFTIAWRRRDQIPHTPLPWLLGVARRVLANQFRSARRWTTLLERVRSSQPPLPSAESCEDDEVVAALYALAPADREALMLSAWDGLSSSEAARVLGCSATAFRLRLLRARRKLARSLEEDGERADIDPFTKEVRP